MSTVGRFRDDRPPFSAIALCSEGSALTAIGAEGPLTTCDCVAPAATCGCIDGACRWYN